MSALNNSINTLENSVKNNLNSKMLSIANEISKKGVTVDEQGLTLSVIENTIRDNLISIDNIKYLYNYGNEYNNNWQLVDYVSTGGASGSGIIERRNDHIYSECYNSKGAGCHYIRSFSLNNIDFTGYSIINVEFSTTKTVRNAGSFSLNVFDSKDNSNICSIEINNVYPLDNAKKFIFSIDVKDINKNTRIELWTNTDYSVPVVIKSKIYKVWLTK